MNKYADTILVNGKVSLPNGQFADAMAIAGEEILAVGSEAGVRATSSPTTEVINLHGRTVIPGLNDSHIHLIRGGLSYNMELRWDGVPSLADALRLLREQVDRTPAPQWVRVVGGWSEFQFAERRMPTLDDINRVAPQTPVFILHLYDRALLNRAALRALGFNKDTPDFPGGIIERDSAGEPTGLLIANPNASILYSTLDRAPKLSPEDQANSSRQFMRELNRLGVTSVIDAGGGFQPYPENYHIMQMLHNRGQMTVRIAYNLFTQRPKKEQEDFALWVRQTRAGAGDDYFKVNGAGEMLTFSAADFEDFLVDRPDLSHTMESELKEVVKTLVQHRWPFRLHATYDESISRFLDVFEEVNREIPFNGLPWFFDHAETLQDRNIDRIAQLNGGVAVQHRMAYQGEYFVQRYGAEAARRTPPIKQIMERGIPVGAGTDATRVASYNPWVAIYWMVSGNTVGGLNLYPESQRLSRHEALRLYTSGSAWFSSDQGRKGEIAPGQLADLCVLSADYFSVTEPEIKRLTADITILGGKIVYASEAFSSLQPDALPYSPDWSAPAWSGGDSLATDARAESNVHHAIHDFANRSTNSVLGSLVFGAGCACGSL